MDLVLARQQKKKVTHAQKVAQLAQAHFADMALPQDQAGAFSADGLGTLRASGLLAIEIGAYDPQAEQRPCGLVQGRFADTVQAIRALSRVDPAVAVLVHVHNALVVRLLTRFGNPAQQTRWLPRLATGTIGAFAATEAGGGSDLSLLATKARRTADGFELQGEKYWITNAREAGLFIVFAMLEGGGMAAFLVDAQTPGLQVGTPIDKMSMRASSTCAVRLEGVRVGEDALLGGPNAGMDIAMYGLVCGRVGIAAQMLGIAEGARDLAIAYARQRCAFGAPIIDHQGVSFPLAQVDAEITAAELMVREAALMMDEGRPHMTVADLANKAKLFASQVAERATSVGVETLGGNGVACQHRMEKLYRDAKVGKIYEGTVNVLLRAIAQAMLD